MPLEEAVPDSVAFIIREDDSVAGTGFAVRIAEDGLPFWYIVTAAHVVSVEVAPGEPWSANKGTKVRSRRTTGGVKDEPVARWLFHPTADVAVTPYMPVRGSSLVAYTLDDSSVNIPSKAQLGEVVYFVGQLAYMPRMMEQNIPMVRSGTIGATYQDNIPVDWFGRDEITETFGHLIDCRSYFGFSGSPCFTQIQIAAAGFAMDDFVAAYPRFRTDLFGLISGHFPQPEQVRFLGQSRDDSQLWVSISAGVAIVTPVEAIIQTLNQPEVGEMRKQDAEERRRARPAPAAVGDRAPDGDDEYRNFEELSKRLFQVPKSEVDKLRDEKD